RGNIAWSSNGSWNNWGIIPAIPGTITTRSNDFTNNGHILTYIGSVPKVFLVIANIACNESSNNFGYFSLGINSTIKMETMTGFDQAAGETRNLVLNGIFTLNTNDQINIFFLGQPMEILGY